jgi:peptidoglycan/LPS O-acetylase OafA/YrhL
MALPALFQKYANRDSRFLKGISKSSYSAYIIHYPIIYFLIYSMRDIPVPQTLRYIAQLIIAIVSFFGIGYVMNRAPVFTRAIVRPEIRQ